MKRLFAVLAVVVVAALLLASGATAQPMSCAALVANETAMQAAAELRGYASALQGEQYDASMGHIMTLLDLAEQLDASPRYGCATVSMPPQKPVLPPTVREATR